MRIKNYRFLFFICVVFFVACENKSAENTTQNFNQTPSSQNNQNLANNIAANDTNKTSNSSNTKSVSNTDQTADDEVDFAGTAGITDKKNEIKGAALLREVRTAQHTNYDRVVFEFEGAELPSYHIEYIDKPVRACGSGNVVPLKGDGWLEIGFIPANAHTEEGQATVKERELSPNHKIIKELKSTCDFEAEVEWVLGVASPNKYRVLELKNPTRLAIDIKH